jgi:Protein of unknown function (DUF3604)
MIKLILAGVILLAIGAAWYTYNEFDSRLTRLTPAVIEALKQTVAQENEDAIIKPAIQKRRVQEINPLNNLYFGDLHVHSSWSFDANLAGNRIEPDDAYRFAQGHALEMMSGEITQLTVPLDFAAVTDHAESFGLFEGCADPDITTDQAEFCDQFENPSVSVFFKLRKQATRRPPVRMQFCGVDGSFCLRHGKTTWQRTQAAADEAYQPGVFTSFYGYEYSPIWPKGGSTHRNIIFRNRNVPEMVVSAFDAPTALDLWRILEATCTDNCEFLTIPHNLNRYYGKAFSRLDEDGGAYTTEDWIRRDRYEPLVELFQTKGNSECARGVGTTDEECNFEQFFELCEPGESVACAGAGSFARDGLKLGLELEKELGFNPLKTGFIGSTDVHNSNPGDTEEWDYRGKTSFKDASARKRLKVRKFGPAVPITHNPGGLAGIWAEENTRDALFGSLKRKETYSTSGTRIALRFFAGWNFEQNIVDDSRRLEMAYQSGVPMGGTLAGGNPDSTPKLLVWAAKDPNNASLDKIQVIKGWLENGEQKEAVFDIACADGRKPVPSTRRCPAHNAEVNLDTCQITESDGEAELKVLWEDENFSPDLASFYYVRVLQNPTCRWSTYDSIRLGINPVSEVPSAIQERAWSSPIWYSPSAPDTLR